MIRAEDRNSLIDILKNIDTPVPLQSEGRNKNHTEPYIFRNIAVLLAISNFFNYPIHIVFEDKPDVIIKCGEEIIGVEITEATVEEWRKFLELAEREASPSALFEPSHFHDESRRRSKAEMLHLIKQEKLSGPGWAGDYPEKKWAELIKNTIDKKLAALSKNRFRKFSSNWLFIYDNLPLVGVKILKAAEYLSNKKDLIWKDLPSFDEIIILSDQKIVRVNRHLFSVFPPEDK